ncbi:CoA transferase [Cellulomonas alba]|uniref:CoA transferase n=1 Tax=Cellulomonas alba TaxID=3053467 RepID=A0ABT7SBR6_9CELL|nr:CoA transferase [Cellulomonas alba]MDM7853627.1 CoA transferase [Cellulomonas alba]
MDALGSLLDAGGRALGVSTDLEVSGPPTLRSAYPVSALATASVGVAGAAVADLVAALGGSRPDVVVHRPLADAWFAGPTTGVDAALPSPWDPLSAPYRTADGWVRLHTNAPHHRAAALRALGASADPAAVAAAVRSRTADDVEAAVVAAGGAAASLRTAAAWARHPQGAAVAAEPLVAIEPGGTSTASSRWDARPDAPLAGLRVLDLTRVLAGPTATQLLAALGADVLRVDPPGWDEPATLPSVMWGKRTARLDARSPEGAATVRALLATADVLVHGYRGGALDHLGLGADERAAVRPGLVDVSLRAYGFTGPWAGRRGFDSLVQFSSGIADTGMETAGADHPVSLPVQALDVATGYLAGAAALAGLARRVRTGTGSSWRLSLARTAAELERARAQPPEAVAEGTVPVEHPHVRATAYGRLAVADPPLSVGGVALRTGDLGAPLGRDDAVWR